MNEHYDKYKETIKKVARRHRLLKDKWIADYLMSNSVHIVSESELICLQFYPDDRKIRAFLKSLRIKLKYWSIYQIMKLYVETVFKNGTQTSLPVSIILSYDWCPFSSILVNHTTNVLLF